MTNAFVVMGYNNTRLGDVKKIESYAREFHDAELILCKGGISAGDREAIRNCIECDLSPTGENVDLIVTYLKDRSLDLVGVLPFSDKGVQIGALLAERLGLPGCDPVRAAGAADKYSYRMAEAEFGGLPDSMCRVRAQEIDDAQDIRGFWDSVAPSKVFLKPRGEGNSRGCTRVDRRESIDAVFAELQPYLAGGVMAEECVDDAREYSVDHVAGFSWVTEKVTTTGAFRAEIQQIVPAPLDPAVESRVRQAGFTAAEVCGHADGAFHNEIFLFPGGEKAAVVEPNSRPAGMRIWDLAALAFDFDPWAAWLHYSREGKPAPEFTDQRGYAGIRMIPAPADGVLSSLPAVAGMEDEFPELKEVVITKKPGDVLATQAADNAGFIGYVICSSPTYEGTQRALISCASHIQNSVGVEAA
ncbi:hypothetical protein [Streptomyces sp. Je 1-332]|uniref:ATP-grasp domain-containing protein n=1 Tax=Streptomyces sp. Je 1-332 TaxID=3231270 RepID=UPI00345A8BF2